MLSDLALEHRLTGDLEWSRVLLVERLVEPCRCFAERVLRGRSPVCLANGVGAVANHADDGRGVVVLRLERRARGALRCHRSGAGLCGELMAVGTLRVDGLVFRDLDHDGVLAPYEDHRLSADVRARDLVSRM